MTKAKRKEWAEAIRTALLCGAAFGFLAASLPVEIKWQFAAAFGAAIASLAYDYYRTLRGGD